MLKRSAAIIKRYYKRYLLHTGSDTGVAPAYRTRIRDHRPILQRALNLK
jgi:hypothetical protein